MENVYKELNSAVNAFYSKYKNLDNKITSKRLAADTVFIWTPDRLPVFWGAGVDHRPFTFSRGQSFGMGLWWDLPGDGGLAVALRVRRIH